MSSGDAAATQAALAAGLLQAAAAVLSKLLAEPSEPIIKVATSLLRATSNVAAGTPAQAQALAASGLMGRLVRAGLRTRACVRACACVRVRVAVRVRQPAVGALSTGTAPLSQVEVAVSPSLGNNVREKALCTIANMTQASRACSTQVDMT